MGLISNYTHKGKVWQNAYTNISVFNVQKNNGSWQMEVAPSIWTEQGETRIRITNLSHEIIPHTPGLCIHEEAYNYLKALPEFAGATDDI